MIAAKPRGTFFLAESLSVGRIERSNGKKQNNGGKTTNAQKSKRLISGRLIGTQTASGGLTGRRKSMSIEST